MDQVYDWHTSSRHRARSNFDDWRLEYYDMARRDATRGGVLMRDADDVLRFECYLLFELCMTHDTFCCAPPAQSSVLYMLTVLA
jgi:hypothetical protein